MSVARGGKGEIDDFSLDALSLVTPPELLVSRSFSSRSGPIGSGIGGSGALRASTADDVDTSFESRRRPRAPGGEREGAGAELPLFHDLVKRSTRFSTAVPAAEVLEAISTVIEKDPFPMKAPFRQIRQRAKIDWDQYVLEVIRGGTAICTVRIYLMRSGLYMVDFLRGSLDIFEFKRFYERASSSRALLQLPWRSSRRVARSALRGSSPIRFVAPPLTPASPPLLHPRDQASDAS